MARGTFFIDMQDQNTLVKLDSEKLKVLETWPLAPCELPTGIAIDRTNRRVFAGCRSGVTAVVPVMISI